MRIETKRILKEDGRYLVYYHFPESATVEQTAAFEAVTPILEMPEDAVRVDAPPLPRPGGEEKVHV